MNAKWNTFTISAVFAILFAVIPAFFNGLMAGPAANDAPGIIDNPIDQRDQARVQIIHNSADALVSQVDIFANGSILLEDVGFRQATPFIDVAAGVDIDLVISPTGAGIENGVGPITVQFDAGETYVVVAAGTVSESGYEPVEPFALNVYGMGREESTEAGNTDVLVFHGSTDAPTVSVWETAVVDAEIIGDFSFGDFAGYLELPTLDFVLEIRDAAGENTVVAYNAPLSTLGLEGEALVVVASGFLNPANNSNGPAFGLFVALAGGGDLIALPVAADVDPIDEFPWFGDFEADWIGDPAAPEGWTVVNGADGSYWERSSVQSNSGQFSARSYQGFASNNMADEWLITPAFDMDNPEAASLLFFGYSSSAPDGVRENIRILALDELYDNVDDLHANAVLLQTVALTQSWEEYIVDISAFDGVKYIAFNYYITEDDNASFNWVYIDDVAVGNFETFELTVLAPIGEGTVVPAEGVYTFTEGTVVNLLATADFGWEFLQWTGDVDDPTSFSTTITMDGDKTVQAEFIEFTAVATPFFEDFTGIAAGQLPSNWQRTHTNWGAWNTNNAGGDSAPELRFNWSPTTDGILRVVTPLIDATNETDLSLVFMYSVNDYSGDYTLRVQTSPDGDTWTDQWELYVNGGTREDLDRSVPSSRNIPSTEAVVNLDDLAGEQFHVAFVYDGNSFNINQWYVDDIYVGTYEGPELASVQIIHNSADALVEEVDIFVNGDLFLEGVGFRQATPFLDVPAGVDLDLVIAPAGAGIENGVGPITVQFETGETYVVVAAGNVSDSGYDPVEPFALYVYDMGQTQANDPDNTDVLAFHGSTDAPTVSVWETAVVDGEIIGDFSFGDFAGYLELPTLDFILEVRDASGEVTVAAYAAPLATLGLQGEALTVLASGFLNPENNSDGPAFGLFVALASGGDLVELPLVEETEDFARLQIIHNSADALVEEVDIFVNGDLFLEGVGFRQATPFLDVPAGVDLDLVIAPAGAGIENGVGPITVQFDADETYVVVAAGNVSDSGYDPVVPFELFLFDAGQEEAAIPDAVDILSFHGSTDAPTVSVWETAIVEDEIFGDFSFGDFVGYSAFVVEDYIIEIRDASGEIAIAAFEAPLATLGLQGEALVIVASGFLNPDNNSDGPAFGLFVALASGGDLVELPLVEVEEEFARVQIIHNSADALVEEVDIFVNGDLFLDGFGFREATPFVDVPAGVDLDLVVAPAGAGIENGVGPVTVQFDADETYIVVAAGNVSGSGYDPVVPFGLYVYDMGREQATNGMNTDVLVFHGSTDAPTVTVWETAFVNGEIIGDFNFGDFAGYLELGTEDYVLEIRDATGTTTVATYLAPLATLGLQGEALVVVASGFLTPDNNSNGPAFGLYVALADGGELIPLPLSDDTSISHIAEVDLVVYPNPVSSNLFIESSEDISEIRLFDMLGQVSYQTTVSTNRYELNVSGFRTGIYFVQINTAAGVITERVQIVN